MNRFAVILLILVLFGVSGARFFMIHKAQIEFKAAMHHRHDCSQRIRQGTNAMQELRGFALVYLLTGRPTYLDLADQKALDVKNHLGYLLSLRLPLQAREALDQVPGLLGKLMDRLHQDFPPAQGASGTSAASTGEYTGAQPSETPSTSGAPTDKNPGTPLPEASNGLASDSAPTEPARDPRLMGPILNAECALIASLFGTAQNWIDIEIEDSLK